MANWFNVFNKLVSYGRSLGAAPLTIDTVNHIHYMMNDPLTPDLIKRVPVPSLSWSESFTVTGYRGGGYHPYTVEGRAAQVHVVLSNTLDGINAATGELPCNWYATDKLLVVPMAGRKLHAYYDRKSLAFFYAKDLVLRKDVYACDSHDIVAHELGHAILDSYRPDLWNIASIEVAAYHDAFADTISFLAGIFNDEALLYILDQTRGDLYQDNVGCCLAGQFGLAICHDYQEGGPTYLRNINNTFKYSNPMVLPDHGSDDDIVANPFSFSRIMSGAYYDIFVMIYTSERGRGIDAIEAMQNARTILCRFLFKSIHRTILHTRFFQSAAYAMLDVAALMQSPYQSAMREIFKSRGIINGTCGGEISPQRVHLPSRHIRLRDVLPIRNKALNPLYDVYLEVPNDGLEGVLSAHNFIQYVQRTRSVSDNSLTPFQICDGNLIRTHIACGCGGGGSFFPPKSQLDRKGPYKPQNNAGCCGGCRQTIEAPAVKKPTVKIGCYVNYRVPR